MLDVYLVKNVMDRTLEARRAVQETSDGVEYAQSVEGVVGICVEDILPGDYGFVAKEGRVDLCP